LRQLTEPLRKREPRQEERSVESVSRRFWRSFFGFQRDVLGRRGASGRNERRPCHSRFGFEIRRFSRDWRNSDQVVATGALNFAAGKSLVAKEMLLAEWTGEFEFAHTILGLALRVRETFVVSKKPKLGKLEAHQSATVAVQ
jgi:hypothetical protein